MLGGEREGVDLGHVTFEAGVISEFREVVEYHLKISALRVNWDGKGGYLSLFEHLI